MRFYLILVGTILGLISCKNRSEIQGDSEVLAAKGLTTQVSCSGNNSSSITARLPKDPTKVKSITLLTIRADDGISAWLNQVGTKTNDSARLPKSNEWKDAIVFALPDYSGIRGLTKRTVMIQPQVFSGESSGERLDVRYSTQVGSEKEKNYLMKCDVQS